MDGRLGEADLQAYIDGQLDTAGRIEVERWLHQHPEAAAATMEGLRLRDEIRLFLDADDWAAAATTVGQARALTRGLTARRTGLRVRRAMAAAVLIGLGWFAHAELGLFVDQVAAAHPVPTYAAEIARSLDRAPASGAGAAAGLPAPKAPRTGGDVPVPHLGDGYRLVAADLVPWEGATALVARYRSPQGADVALFAVEAPDFDVLWPRSANVQGHPTVFWQTGPYAYALSGGVGEAVLLDLARDAGPRPWASFILTSPTQGAPHG
jgi:anti-sigma factor RsiW